MFNRVKSALKDFLDTMGSLGSRRLAESEVDKALEKLRLDLIQANVAYEVTTEIIQTLRPKLVGMRVQRFSDYTAEISKIVRATLLEVFQATKPIDLEKLLEQKDGRPFVIVFLGINGSGKTTTIAKLAHILKNKGKRVLLACADTHRPGAIEQLAEHARRIGVRMITQKYGADPAAVARDAVEHAESTGIQVVLIDTAGRLQTNKNLMEEMRKIIRVVQPDLKIFVGDSLTGNDSINQAREFQKFTDFDAIILTKADADVKGGAALSMAKVTGRPIIFLGMGQAYEDLQPFDAERMVSFLVA
jgi:fused signal recognition particle receptor